MKEMLFPALWALAGLYFLIKNLILLRNDEKFESYMRTSPKAKLWVEKMGFEKACRLSRKVFLPLGIFVSLVLLGMAAYWVYLTMGK